LTEAARRFNVPVIVIWAGSDVLDAASDPGQFEIIKEDENINITDGPWLVEELRQLGVDATYVPVTAIEAPPAPAPLPRDFRVVTYLPEPRRAFYGEKLVYGVAREFPQIPFLVVGKGHANAAAPPNVRFLGHVHNMPQILDQATVLLRLPEHDGKSMLVLETLARARHVIWTYDFPSVHRATTMSEAIDQMRGLYDAHRSGMLQPNYQGYEYVRERFSRAMIAANFENALDGAVSKGSVTPKRAYSAAISGYPLFAAQLAHGVRAGLDQWEPRILRNDSRLARFASLVQLLRANVWYTIGSPIPDRLLHALATIARKPRVVHWVGSDVELLKTQPAVQKFCRRDGVRHLAEVDWIVDELALYGVRASVAPLPPQVRVPDQIPALPDRFTVLLYVPRARRDFYGRREYERLFRTFLGRPIRFLVVGGGSIFVPQGADVEVLGWKTDLSDVYSRVSALLRFTRHDGLSLMALEALSYGRHLIWSQAFPFAHQARTYADCEATVASLLDAHERGELKPQLDAARFVRETYDARSCVKRIAEHWLPSQDAIPILSAAEAKR
jgi:hypothetical protein